MATDTHASPPPRPSDASSLSTHLPALDGLRAIAIGLVLWHHAPFIFGRSVYAYAAWRMSAMGWLGVDLFFVISGFLITSILVRTKGLDKSLRVFWVRRALRIFPLAYLYLFLLLACGYFQWISFFPGLKPLSEWPWYFFYLTNFRAALYGWPGTGIGLMWSLAIEEQFYLLWPLVVFLLRRRVVVCICAGIILLAPLARFLTFIYADNPHPAVFVLPWCRFDTLAVGALLALAYDSPRYRPLLERWCRTLTLPAIAVLLALAAIPLTHLDRGIFPRNTLPFAVFGYSVVALSCGVLVGAAAAPGRIMQRVLGNRASVYIGKRSYGMYLWHPLVGHTVRYFVPIIGISAIGFAGAVTVFVAGTVLIASLSWSLYEMRFLNLKRKFQVRREQAADARAAPQ